LSFYAAPFGTSTDILVPGDYDGDNKYDLAVFRPSNTTWFVLRSTQGALIQGFGSTGDIPTPSAYIP
jgi:putative transposon-encoded protein